MSDFLQLQNQFPLPAIDSNLRSQISGEAVAFATKTDKHGKELILKGNFHTGLKELHRIEPVLLVHSFGGNKQEYNGLFLKMAFELTCAGFDVLRFDSRGCGESDGTTDDIHPAALIDDVIAAQTWLLERTRAQRMHLAGYSLGGLIAALSLPETASHLASLTLMQSPFNLGRELKRRYPMGFDGLRTSVYVNAPLFKMGADFKSQLPVTLPASEGPRADKLFETLRHRPAKLPVLLLTGALDVIVPQSNEQEWLAYFQSSLYATTTFCLPQTDHGFSSQAAAELCIGRLCEFLSSASAS